MEAEAWLRDKKQQQDALPKHATPVLRSADVRKKAEEVDRSSSCFLLVVLVLTICYHLFIALSTSVFSAFLVMRLTVGSIM